MPETTIPTVQSPYDAHIQALARLHGQNNSGMNKEQKINAAMPMWYALHLIDDLGQDVDTAWRQAIVQYGCMIPQGFRFVGLTGEALTYMLRSQLRSLALQSCGLKF